MQDIFDDWFWKRGFENDKKINQACQILSSLPDQQKKNLKTKYIKNPFLFLRFKPKMLKELKKIGINIAVDHNDQNKIFAISGQHLINEYDKIFDQKNDYFDYVKGDGNCQTYAAMRAFDYKPEEINEKTAYELRKEVAVNIDKKSYKNLLEEKKWIASWLVMSYLSKKYKRPAWDINLNIFNGQANGMAFNTFHGASFQDILYDCPVVVLNGGAHNHSINLTADRAKRKKFALEFFDLFAKAYAAYIFRDYYFYFCIYDQEGLVVDGCNYNFVEVNSKNNFYELIIPSLLSALFKKLDKQEIVTQLKNFFNGVKHRYKNMVATKLILYVFDKYKSIILEPFDINMPEDKFPTANKFLSDVINEFAKDLDQSKKIFGGQKWLYIFLCIITLGIFYFVYDPPGKKQDEPLIGKNYTSKITTEKNNIQNKQEENDKKMITSKQEFNPETQPLLINLNNENKKINYDQHEH